MEASGSKRVAVIGAGASGLSAIKCCLDEGLIPVCFERGTDIGGLWNFSDEPKDGESSVLRSTTINSSKEMMAFSDFPPPEGFSPNMHHSQVMQYFRLYAEHFRLQPHMRFCSRVDTVRPTEDFDSTGQWEIQSTDLESQEKRREIYDGVLVCTGHHAKKYLPTFEGEEDFQGKILHSHDYRDGTVLPDKDVAVVGFGNSAGDLAVELSRFSRKVYVSTRRGAWVRGRSGARGLPFDMQVSSRYGMFLMSMMPWNMLNNAVEKAVNENLDHEVFSLKPEHRIFSCHPLVNDDLPHRIISGRICIKPNVNKFTKTGIEFDDGTTAENIDTIFCGTGYTFGFPFIEHEGYEVRRNEVQLYKYMYAPNVQPHTLAVIGLVQPLGSTVPIAEMQNRVACRVIKGECSLPSSAVMWREIRAKQCAMQQRYVSSQRHTLQVDFIPFMDELADLIGCKPSVGRLLLTSPRLARDVYFGPCTSYQYRLLGPGAWPGAAEALTTAWQRTLFPLKTRSVSASKDSKRNSSWKTLVAGVVAVTAVAAFAYHHVQMQSSHS